MADFSQKLAEIREWLATSRAVPLVAIFSAALAVPLAMLFLMPTFLAWIAPPLDMSRDLYTVNRPLAFTFIDANGKQVGHRGAEIGERLKLDEMPDYLPAAFIAMEDRRFYSHGGFDVWGLLRAMLSNVRAGRMVAGGSTITQQTAKIVFLTPERTLSRKFTELLDAAELEKSLSKKQILELYLNRIYLGSAAYGVDGAAHTYFNKSAAKLTLSEAAMLAALTKAPSVFNPRRDLARAQVRSRIVLDAMVETGAITEEQAEEAKKTPATITDRRAMDARNYFLDTAADEARKLVTKNGEALAFDLVVYTTLEPRIQEAARKSATQHIKEKGKRGRVSEAAVVVMKTDGAVTAMIGGVDYDESVFNRATLAKRQPGSSFKPFVYLAALETGLTPWDVRNDEPVDINGWTPTNYGGRSYGMLTLREALTHSVNTIAANLAQEVGLSNVIDAAHRVGISSELQQHASLALGTAEVTPLEMTTAYATFASGGLRARPYLVRRIESASGRLLYQRQAPIAERVVASHVNKDLTMMMNSVVTSGTGRGASVTGYEVAGKTGTTQDYHDAWFVGFTRDYVTAVWVGNDDNKPMRGVTGGTLPALIWRDTMTVAEKGLTPRPLDKSPFEAPPDSGIYDSGVSVSEGIIDHPDDEAPPPEPGQRGSFWDWVFGREENRPPPPPPQPAPPPAVPPDGYYAPPQQQYQPQRYDQYAPRPTDPDE